MKKRLICALFLIFLFSSNFVLAEDSRSRAYLVDGVNGTRSGPVRLVNDKEKLEVDRKYLVEHAQSNERSSGVAKPGDKFWTDLPADRIFKIRKEK
ncbi:MAG: hypothetical protein ACI88H_002776 [Cocleimonas sp.]|jgi:hypothetical protein